MQTENDNPLEWTALTAELLGSTLLLGPDAVPCEGFDALLCLEWPQEAARAAERLAEDAREAQADEAARSLRNTLFTRDTALGAQPFALYQSVYETGLAMQEPRDGVRRFMREAGLARPQSCVEPEDHIGVELLFWAHALRESPETAARFAKAHLSWIEAAYAAGEFERLQAGTVRDALTLAAHLPALVRSAD